LSCSAHCPPIRSDDDLLPVFIPALVALLIQAEELNGSPLTRNQVVAIRDNADCVDAAAIDESRDGGGAGYADIDPERCWGGMVDRASQDVGRLDRQPPLPRNKQQ
jgi:hypothetical protein